MCVYLTGGGEKTVGFFKLKFVSFYFLQWLAKYLEQNKYVLWNGFMKIFSFVKLSFSFKDIFYN